MLILILLILKSCPLLARSDNVFDEDSQYLQDDLFLCKALDGGEQREVSIL